MKRYFFTVTELLAVIAVILILAAIGGAVLINSRGKARLASCVSNQGQTMKMMISAMNSSDGRIISGNTDDTRYTKFLMDKKLLQDLEVVRCPDLSYQTESREISDAAARKEAYGMVISSAADGKFNFKSNRIRRVGTVEVSSGSMLMGGCTAGDYAEADAVAALDFSSGRLIPVHSGEIVNTFFLDGSVSSLTAEEFKSKTFYYPKGDSSGAEKVDPDKLLTK